MKEYTAPDVEKVDYDVDECLTGSLEIPVEDEDITDLINLV